jgi:DNA helicase IV
MNRLSDEQKQEMLRVQQKHVLETCDAIITQRDFAEKKIVELEVEMRRPAPYQEKVVAMKLMQHYSAKKNALAAIGDTPYFCRCEVNGETWYFGKQSFSESRVYSWVVPAAALRYAALGDASYTTVNGVVKNVELSRKDQYVISDRKISFFATEMKDVSRTIVYQEHLTRRKSGFVLPEIVEQMEKAQDDVVRAHWQGPLLIGGPAGSGKTTLALHRVAYLLQAPELSDIFPQDETIVFVHDGASKDYFAGLFPELGLSGVKITTFHEWAMELLGLGEREKFVFRFGWGENERDLYELAKKEAIRNRVWERVRSIDIWDTLRVCYEQSFSDAMMEVFGQQQRQRCVDRFDLALLLHAQRYSEGRIAHDVEYYDRGRTGQLARKVSRVGVSYRLMVVDEIQNWLPQELEILRGCLDPETQAIMFVGDTRQKTRIGSVERIEDVGFVVSDERRVVLEKVYRNTRQIVEYCVRRGYDVKVLAGLQDGPPVREEQRDAVAVCRGVADSLEEGQTLGVVVFSPEMKREFTALGERAGVHVVTVHEAQGLEFEKVVVVESGFGDAAQVPELQRIQRDLLYVAFTRAMRELVVVRDIV